MPPNGLSWFLAGIICGGFPGGPIIKNPPANAGVAGSISGSGRFPWSRKWQPAPVFLLERVHGQRSLVAKVYGITRVWHDSVTEHSRHRFLNVWIQREFTPPWNCNWTLKHDAQAKCGLHWGFWVPSLDKHLQPWEPVRDAQFLDPSPRPAKSETKRRSSSSSSISTLYLFEKQISNQHSSHCQVRNGSL